MKKHKTEIVYREQIISILLAILEIAGHDVKNDSNFENEYKKWLKFQKQTDWKKYRASVDLLVDTEYAIISAFEFQLGYLKSKHRDIGEMYLRLYGILNAVYLQIGAFESIANLLNYPKRIEIKDAFKEITIFKLRNIAGAHTVDYMYPEKDFNESTVNGKRTSFRIIQIHLEKTGSNIVALDENNLIFKFNLLELLSEYHKYSTEVLIDLINHMATAIVKRREDKTSVTERLNELLSHLIDYTEINKNSKA
jgi:hypothetical protein